MRRILTIASSLLLAFAVAAPVASAYEGQYITDLKVTSVQVFKTGDVLIKGSLYCQNMDNFDLNINGQLVQSIGRKTGVRGGIWGGTNCNPNGPTYWEAWSFADWGAFGPGWMTVQINFENGGCDENGCWGQTFGGGSFYVKATK